MTQHKHTPGPWTAKEYKQHNIIIIHSSKWDEVAGIDMAAIPDAVANSALITAAPDLLAACEVALECADMSGAVRAMLTDAIKKARGGS